MIGSVVERARSARRNDVEYSKIGWMAKQPFWRTADFEKVKAAIRWYVGNYSVR